MIRDFRGHIFIALATVADKETLAYLRQVGKPLPRGEVRLTELSWKRRPGVIDTRDPVIQAGMRARERALKTWATRKERIAEGDYNEPQD